MVAGFAGNVVAQAVLIGVGPEAPIPVVVAPNEVTFVYAQLGKPVPLARANSMPLPTELEGVSVWIGADQPLRRVPLFAIERVYACEGCEAYAGIRVQVPREYATEWVPGAEAGALWVDVDGKRSPPMRFVLRRAKPVFVGRCPDITLKSAGPCRGELWHADGTAASQRRPRPGDVLVIYAYGLGLTQPAQPSGRPADAGLGPVEFPGIPPNARLLIDFRPNFHPGSRSGPVGTQTEVTPLFAGLVAGFVGLYQVNFRMPTPAGPLASCDYYDSNATVWFSGVPEYVPLCMEGGQ
ncbi:MAG: hypothetical protein IT168_22450 [Bryobacterales bacterium]|nr:hypothetical protein [Bryobacterales bacterium]